MLDWPLLTRAASTTPASPESAPGDGVDDHQIFIHIDAGHFGRGHVAADGIHIFAIPGMLQRNVKHGGDHEEDNHRHRPLAYRRKAVGEEADRGCPECNTAPDRAPKPSSRGWR